MISGVRSAVLPTTARLTLEIPLLNGDLTEKPVVQYLFCMSYYAVAVTASFSSRQREREDKRIPI